MAITIITEVTEPRYSPAGNPLVYVVDSDNSTEPNFRYVANVSINGNLVAKLKTVPSVTNSNRGRFNFQEIVRGYFDVIPRIADGSIVPAESFGCPTQYIEFDVEFDEEYTGGSPAPMDADTAIIYNGAWTVFDFAQFPYFKGNYWIDNDAVDTRLPLTNRPQSTKAYANFSNTYNQSGNLYFLCDKNLEGNIDAIRYRYYYEDGTMYREYTIPTVNGQSHASSEENEFHLIAVPFMPFDVQNISGSITSDSQDGSTDFPSLVSSGNNYYTVTAFRDVEGTQQASIEYTVLLNGECSRFEFTEVHFENQLGGVDSYVFTKPNRERQTIQRTEASRPYLTDGFEGNSGIYGGYTNFSKYNAQVDYNKEFTVSSDWLTDEEFEWLAQMVRSPRIWLRKAFNTDEGVIDYLVPILVTDTSYNVWKRDFDLLKTLSVNFKYTFDETSPL
jgi:hypothetical protein